MNTILGSFALFVGLLLILLGGRMMFRAQAEWQQADLDLIRDLRKELR